MREILLTSSVLILAVLLLRRAFRDRISRRAQYVLWALVLVRLLAAGEPAGRRTSPSCRRRSRWAGQ